MSGGTSMNKKERIIELVKQNIITIDEALDLLEAGDIETDQFITTDMEETSFDVESTETDEDTTEDNSVTSYFDDYAKQYNDEKERLAQERRERKETEQRERRTQLESLNKELETVRQEIAKTEKALTITNQRLKELDLFDELGELTEQMAQQREELLMNKDRLEEKQASLNETVERVNKDKRALGFSTEDIKEELKSFWDTNSEQFTETAKQMSEDAVKEGKKWSKVIADKAQAFAENFNLKDMNVNVQVPWVKSEPYEFNYTYPAENLHNLQVKNFNGNVKVETHDESELKIYLEGKTYGKSEHLTKEYWEEKGLVDYTDGVLNLSMNSPMVSVNIRLVLPKVRLENVTIDTMNGNIKLYGVATDRATLASKNGDVKIKDVDIVDLNIDMYNGDTYIKEAQINTIVHHTMNGDFRLRGAVENLSIDSINSDCYITKTDEGPARLLVKTFSGEIKLAVPETMNLDINAVSTHGDVFTRLDQIDEQATGRIQRDVDMNAGLVQADLTCTTGDIYLKNN